jgi:hypothetical protein
MYAPSLAFVVDNSKALLLICVLPAATFNVVPVTALTLVVPEVPVAPNVIVEVCAGGGLAGSDVIFGVLPTESSKLKYVMRTVAFADGAEMENSSGTTNEASRAANQHEPRRNWR